MTRRPLPLLRVLVLAPVALAAVLGGCTPSTAPAEPIAADYIDFDEPAEPAVPAEPVRAADPICALPAAPGTCEAYFPAWYFDAATGTCEPFVYGGCEGNDNRFATQLDCQQRCGG